MDHVEMENTRLGKFLQEQLICVITGILFNCGCAMYAHADFLF
jgi:hypothetical protein